MKAQVVEISGYIPAFISLYMTNKKADDERLDDIIRTVSNCVNSQGFVTCDGTILMSKQEEYAKFFEYLTKVLKYGIKNDFGKEGHGSLLDFIKISIVMNDLHRGAMDDYDAHAKRLDIIRSSTRANNKSSAANAMLSDWYKDKIMTFEHALAFIGEPEHTFPDEITDPDGNTWVKTHWGYVLKRYSNNNDVLRGLVPLGLACDSISTVSYRNLRHIYSLRRRGTHASPELQEAMEQVRKDLMQKCWPLGDLLGKVWVPSANDYIEETEVVNARSALSVSFIEREVRTMNNELTDDQVRKVVDRFWHNFYYTQTISEFIEECIEAVLSGEED